MDEIRRNRFDASRFHSEPVPELPFAYEKSTLHPQLTHTDLEEPEPNVFDMLPNEMLSMICEKLAPTDFESLSQTCRDLHQRMLSFCHCTVAEQDIHVCQSIGPDGKEIVEWTQSAEYLHRKHVRFQHINLIIRVPQDYESFMETIIGVVARERCNYKTMEIFADDIYTICCQNELLLATRASRVRSTRMSIHNHPVEYEKMPHWDRNSTPLLYKDIVIDQPLQIYPQNVPVEGIITMVKYFLNEEMPTIWRHKYSYDPDEHETLRKSLKELKKWAVLEKGLYLEPNPDRQIVDDEDDLDEGCDVCEGCITLGFSGDNLMRYIMVANYNYVMLVKHEV